MQIDLMKSPMKWQNYKKYCKLKKKDGYFYQKWKKKMNNNCEFL